MRRTMVVTVLLAHPGDSPRIRTSSINVLGPAHKTSMIRHSLGDREGTGCFMALPPFGLLL